MPNTNPKPITVRFRQRFISGICNGLEYDGAIGFPDVEMAEQWIDGMVGKTVRPGPFSGSSAYKILAAAVEEAA